MDQFAKDKAFNYVIFLIQPANQVIKREGNRKNREAEPSGEPESLVNRININ